MNFDAENVVSPGAKIKVIGVGGAGGNAINTMIRSNLEGVEFAAANTDVQALRFSLADCKLQLGRELTKGLGAGADPDIGRDAALEDRQAIQEALLGSDMVFITAGMGGGTGTGGAAVIAQIAREMGALTVAVVTKPFSFEGKRRRKHAELGIARLRESVDTLITIPNQRLLQIATPDLSMIDAFRMADNVLVNAVRGISDIINVPGTVNVDFADVKTVMSSMGLALMGIGSASGPSRAVEAARQAICSPLLEDVNIEGATGILINITAGSNITLMEVNEACSIIQEAAHEDANIIFGAVIDESVGDQIRVTVIATGFPSDQDDSDDFSHGASPTFQKTTRDSQTNFRVQQKASVAQYESRPFSKNLEPTIPLPAAAPMVETVVVDSAPQVFSPTHQQSNSEIEQLFNISSPVFTPIQEAQGLTQWTLGQNHNDLSTSENSGSLEPRISGASLASDFEESDFTNSDLTDLSDTSTHIATITPQWNQNTNLQDDHPIESFFSKEVGAEIASEQENQASVLHQKIDEALELAERLKGVQNTVDHDELDVPAFLRHSLKDLSLS